MSHNHQHDIYQSQSHATQHSHNKHVWHHDNKHNHELCITNIKLDITDTILDVTKQLQYQTQWNAQPCQPNICDTIYKSLNSVLKLSLNCQYKCPGHHIDQQQ